MHINLQFHRKWNTDKTENGCLRAIPALLDDSAWMTAGVYKIWYCWKTWRRDTQRKYHHLIWPFGVRSQGAKGAKRWKGANVQTTVSWVSQPVALSGLTSICSNPWKDEEPLITWTGLTVRASCSGSSSGEQKSGAELVIQQKRLMIMDGVCSLYWTHLLLVVSCPPSRAHQYIFSLPSSSVILCTPLRNVRYRITKVPATTVV